jgi:hypothetical protein
MLTNLNANDNDSNQSQIKIITIEPPKNKNNKNDKNDKNDKNIKNINFNKEIKMRIETKTWGLTEEHLSHQSQLTIIQKMDNNLNELKCCETDPSYNLFTSHIKAKIYGYKQQDILKKRLDENKLIKFDEIIHLLSSSKLKCHYCNEDVFILYEKVREAKQWTLDRINNNVGHNIGNLLVACLNCNLKRRRTNKDKFMFTKNMVIHREGLN